MSTESNPPAPPANTAPTGDDRTIAVLSYLTVVGLLIALVMHGKNKTELGAYHLRQTLGFFITAVVIGVALMILGLIPFVNLILVLLSPLVGIGLFVLWLLGLISAIQGQQKPMPVFGASYQSWFASAFI